jgi:hypothetical protein
MSSNYRWTSGIAALGLLFVSNSIHPLASASGWDPAPNPTKAGVTEPSSAAAAPAASTPARPGEGYAVPLSFEPNHGQAGPEVKFMSRSRGFTLFLTATEAVIAMRAGGFAPADRQTHKLRMQLVGANPTSRVTGEGVLPGKVNYVRGSDPSRWRTDISTYGRVRYEEIYPGIDVVYYHQGGDIEYDFVVGAGGDPDSIRLAFTGAEKVAVNGNGDLVLQTAAGEIRQPRPVVYQEVDGVRRPVSGGYMLDGDSRVGFRLGAYDRARPLVIDPVLVYSTFLGGSGQEMGWDIAVDGGRNAYVTGYTPSLAGTDYDAFVAKYSPAGALLWLTMLGDNCEDEARSIAVSNTGEAYVTGQLGYCYPFPTLSPGAFVAKLNAAGTVSYVFPFSDYWYGASDLGQAIAVDTAGRAYVAGLTSSESFPTTPGAFQPQFGGGMGDGFVVKVNAAGNALLYGTYLGGEHYESLNDIAVDGAGSAFVTGSTDSRDFPVTPAAFQREHRGWHPGNRNGFVTKLNAAGSALQYSTYLGGADDDIAQGLAIDVAGNAYVTGVVTSADFPTTPGAFQPVPPGWRACFRWLCSDAFISKLNPSGSALVYSTYLGGDLDDSASGIAVDAMGNAYVTGDTYSFTFPVRDAFQPEHAGVVDAFVTKLNAAGSSLVYSSHLGGGNVNGGLFEGEDGGVRIAVDRDGRNAYVTGVTRSLDFPVTTGAQQPTFGGGVCGTLDYVCSDAFVTKIGPPQ